MNNEPAFPSTFPRDYGLTMRDYFAAKAMYAFVSRGVNMDVISRTATNAYTLADEMMKARELE